MVIHRISWDDLSLEKLVWLYSIIGLGTNLASTEGIGLSYSAESDVSMETFPILGVINVS
jgi:hypothetical protein